MSKPPPTPLQHAQHLGAQIRALRLERGFTQAQLADGAGISRAHLAALERGLSSATKAPPRPSRATLGGIASTLGVDLGVLLGPTPIQPSLWETPAPSPEFRILEAVPGAMRLSPGNTWRWPEADGIVSVETSERPELGLEVGCMVLVQQQAPHDAPEGLVLIATAGAWRWEQIARIQQRIFVLARDGSYQPLSPLAVIAAKAIAILRPVG